MFITCLDLEGVLVPEIWIAFAEASGIPELKRTTRDEPDYDKLMKWRLGILKEHGLGLKEIQETIEKIDPMPGARAFLDDFLIHLQKCIVILVALPVRLRHTPRSLFAFFQPFKALFLLVPGNIQKQFDQNHAGICQLLFK